MSISELLNLPTDEKILLVEQIWDSLDTKDLQVSDLQKKEIDRRINLDENGQMSWHSWSEVKSYLHSKKH